MRGVLLLCVLACGTSNATPDAGIDATVDAGPTLTPGEDTNVTAFDKADVHFTSTENTRTIDQSVTFPETGEYAKIILHISLGCPKVCDAWDRFGTLGIVTSGDKTIELARFITPYGKPTPGTWDFDVTDLRPLLRGSLTMRVFIDTWVGPGSQYGFGWLFSASFEMQGGIPERVPLAVTPLWTLVSAPYGDPAKPLDQSIPSQSPTLPPTATGYALRSFLTGHGQGNLSNCAEFCPRTPSMTANDVAHTMKLWRDDCEATAVPNQLGNWKPPRAGWCPGAAVTPWVVDITSDVTDALNVSFGIDTYVNTCRPDAVPDGGTCTGCTLGADCPYDGGGHTEPTYYFSSLLIAYH